jgi:hypothetical protein
MRLLLTLSLLLVAPFAQAQLFTGTIAGGTGNAGRAAIEPSESAFLNPATVAYFGNYVLSGQYQTGELNPTTDFNTYALQISDGSPQNLIPGALSFVHNVVKLPGGGGDLKQTDFQVTLGEMFLSRFSFGLSIHHLIQEGAGLKDRQTNANLGFMFTPTERIGFGLVGYDLVPAEDSVTPARQLQPSYALGSNFILSDEFQFRADVVKPGVGSRGRMDVGVGLQSFFNQFLSVRLGLQAKETAGETNVTAGLGYRGPRISLDYSFQQDTRAAGSTRHLVDLWLPL